MMVLQDFFKTQSYFGGEIKSFLITLMHSNIRFEVIKLKLFLFLKIT